MRWLKQRRCRQALVSGDVGLFWRMFAALFPELDQPATWQQAEIQMHATRTISESVPVRLRCYSHHWLLDRDIASGLPYELRPEAEKHKPRVVSAVGFAWGSSSPLMRQAEPLIVAAVGARIEEMAADGMLETKPDEVRTEMLLEKNRVLHGLFGNFSMLVKEARRDQARTHSA